MHLSVCTRSDEADMYKLNASSPNLSACDLPNCTACYCASSTPDHSASGYFKLQADASSKSVNRQVRMADDLQMKNPVYINFATLLHFTLILVFSAGGSIAQELNLTCTGKLESLIKSDYAGVQNAEFQNVNRVYVFKGGEVQDSEHRFFVSCKWTDDLITCSNAPMVQCGKTQHSLYDNPHCANHLKIFRSNGQVRETTAYSFSGQPLGKGFRVDDFSGLCEKSIKKF